MKKIDSSVNSELIQFFSVVWIGHLKLKLISASLDYFTTSSSFILTRLSVVGVVDMNLKLKRIIVPVRQGVESCLYSQEF